MSNEKAFNVKVKLNKLSLERLNHLLNQADIGRNKLFDQFISDILDGKIIIKDKGVIIYESCQ